MDPLGAKIDVKDVQSLTKWNFTQLPEYSIPKGKSAESPFPCRNDLNSKIILWNGDITSLNVHGIVNTTNEHLTDKHDHSQRMHQRAGPELQADIKANIRVCRTGEAKLTKGYHLPARFIIHTVGPKYSSKYITAAQSALFSCYRSIFQLCRENNIKSLALCPVHTVRRGYPPEEGAHLAIRTIRRFLENHPKVLDSVVIVCSEENLDAYEATLPLYFPRNGKEEEYACTHLPEDVGNVNGEPIFPDRQIRILDKPVFAAYKNKCNDFEETIDLNREFATSIDVGHHPFSQMEDDLDRSRKHYIYGKSASEQRQLDLRRRYERLVKRSMTEDLTEIAALRCLYRSGVDRHGRPVIVFVAKNFAASLVNLEKAVMYMLRLFEPVVLRDYVIVYFHTQSTSENHPPLSFLREVYNILDHKYKKNLRAFYIVHPTIWSKLAAWFFTTFTASAIKDKVFSLSGVQYLYSKINPDQLDTPPFVLDYDLEVNGPRYYIPPEEDSHEAL